MDELNVIKHEALLRVYDAGYDLIESIAEVLGALRGAMNPDVVEDTLLEIQQKAEDAYWNRLRELQVAMRAVEDKE